MYWSNLPGPVNIGNPTEMSILETAEVVREICRSDSPITFIPRPVDDPTVRRPDISLAREGLGWEPLVDIRDGLAKTADWFAEQLVPNWAA
jgi:dTDP-glucose 4,6-dehydratase